MANSITSSDAILSWPVYVQKVVASIDTDDTVVSQALDFQETPLLVIPTTSSQGTDVVQLDWAIDTTNWELDLKATVENSGTIGTHEVTCYVVWAQQADRYDGVTTNAP